MSSETIKALLSTASEEQLSKALSLALTDEDCNGYHGWKWRYDAAKKAFVEKEWENEQLVFLLSRTKVSTDFLSIFA